MLVHLSPAVVSVLNRSPQLHWRPNASPGEGVAGVLELSGDWRAEHLADMERRLRRERAPAPGVWQLREQSAGLVLDSAAAWLLRQFAERLRAQGVMLETGTLPVQARVLFEMAGRSVEVLPQPAPPALLEAVGRSSVGGVLELSALLALVGRSSALALRRLFTPWRLRWREIAEEVQDAGVRALPIVMLMAFLIGVVIAYQGGNTLERYGANVFLVQMVGITMLREMAPLIAAILVAGRTGSSYAARIGAMKIAEELDALRALGRDPNEVLVLPRMVALMIVLPLLVVAADVFGVLGGMLISDRVYGLPADDFLQRMPSALPPQTLGLGLLKAPVFAALIAAVGCFQGLNVRGDAESVGRATTVAVVQAIVLVIVADAAFAITFSQLRI